MLNRIALRCQLRRWRRSSIPSLLWTFTPYTYGLEETVDAVVYHLVDLIHENPGVDGQRFQQAERQLAGRVSAAVATSTAVKQHLDKIGFSHVMLRTNVADTSDFMAAVIDAPRVLPSEVIFCGAITETKLDLDLLKALSEELNGRGRLVLAGPVDEATRDNPVLRELMKAGVEFTGHLDREQLARRLAEASVGIVPYRISPLTAGISPLKTFEYLAAGLPVVSTPLPEMKPVDECVWVAPNRANFIERTMALLDSPRMTEAVMQRRQHYARENDWADRGAEYRGLVRKLIRRTS
jgi:glycosyltransferase involved in cell wall biosynthesis